MSDWDEIRDALEPTAAEVDRLVKPLDPKIVAWAADATAPSAAEVAALRPIRAPAVAWPRLVVGGGGLLALAAAVALAIRVPDVQEVGPGVPIGATFHLEGAGARIDHAVSLMGVADVRVVTVSPTMTEVEIVQGAVAFEHMAPRRLVVRAGDVVIEADDARFEIVALAGSVEVTVARGDAVARVGGRTWTVAEGERWRWPVEAVAAAGAPDLPLAVPLAIVEVPAPPPAVSVPPAVAAKAPPVAAEAPSAPPAPSAPGVAAVAPPAPPVAPSVAVAVGPVASPVAAAASAAPPVAPAEGSVAFAVVPPVRPVAGSVAGVDPAALLAGIVERWRAGASVSATITELDRLLAAHPTSPAAEDAMALRLRLRVDEGPPQAALAEMEAWLSLSPRSPRRAEVVGLAGALAREQLNDCGRALPHYRELAATTGAPDAHAWHGLCAIRERRPDEGKPALEAAVAAGVSGPLRDQVTGVLDRLR